MKKKKEVKRQLVAAEARIKTLEGLVVEKDKQINRLYIYSRRQGERGAPTMRSSVSTGNLSSTEPPRPATSHHYPGSNQGDNMDSILARLDDRLRKFTGAEEPAKEEVGDSAAVQMDRNGQVNGEDR